jgi:hypothetical protein
VKFTGSTGIGNTITPMVETNGGIVVGSSASTSNAIFEIVSTQKGFLPPRMTETQRTSISSPATALIVYQTDGDEGLYVYKSFGWVQII